MTLLLSISPLANKVQLRWGQLWVNAFWVPGHLYPLANKGQLWVPGYQHLLANKVRLRWGQLRVGLSLKKNGVNSMSQNRRSEMVEK